MNKSTGLTDICRAALVEKRQSKQRDKGRWDQSLSFIEIVAFANLTAERMGIDRHPCGNTRLPWLSDLPFPFIKKKRDKQEKKNQPENDLCILSIHTKNGIIFGSIWESSKKSLLKILVGIICPPEKRSSYDKDLCMCCTFTHWTDPAS